MKRSDFDKKGKPVKKEVVKKGEKVDPYKALKKAYAKPTRVAHVGGKGFV